MNATKIATAALNTMRLEILNTEEHWAATTPEEFIALHDAAMGHDSRLQFVEMGAGHWHVFTHGDPGQGRQFLGSAFLTTPPKGLVIFEGEYMTPADAMALAGY